jgi:hypothetical protein
MRVSTPSDGPLNKCKLSVCAFGRKNSRKPTPKTKFDGRRQRSRRAAVTKGSGRSKMLKATLEFQPIRTDFPEHSMSG